MKVRLGYNLTKPEEYIELEIESYDMKPSWEERIYEELEDVTIFFKGKLDSKQKRLKLEDILKKEDLIFRDEKKGFPSVIRVNVDFSEIKVYDEQMSKYSLKLKQRPNLSDDIILLAEMVFAKRIKQYKDRINKLERTLKELTQQRL